MAAINPSTDRRRLDSWKEIASFFGRDERTVNRWEKELGLPIHRLPGTKGRVYAYVEELSAWLAASKNAAAASPVYNSVSQVAVESSRLTAVPGSHLSPRGAELTTHSSGRFRRMIGLMAATVLGMGVMALALFHPNASHSPKTAALTASQRGQTSFGGVALASSPSHDPEAEQLYLKGRYYWNKRTPDDLNKSLDYFMQAIVHDPNYSQAYVGMADCYNLMPEFTLMPSSEAYPRARAAAKKAVELDDQSSEAHASLAFVSFFGTWDLAAGEREFRRAIVLNPNLADPHHWYANALLALNRFPEALVEIDRAQSLDPASVSILADKGNILLLAGRRDEGFTLLKQMESREPAFRSTHGYLKGGYYSIQDYPDYFDELRKEARIAHDDSELAVGTAAEKGFAEGGTRGMVEATLQVQKKLYALHSLPPTELASTFLQLGNKNEALRYLGFAYEQRDNELLFLQAGSQFKSLYDEPAYRNLVARIGLAPRD
jgi:tetratricopeptide (TPR) repeat protein